MVPQVALAFLVPSRAWRPWCSAYEPTRNGSRPRGGRPAPPRRNSGRLDDVSAPTLLYPYWWQAKYDERLGQADLALLGKYRDVSTPTGGLHRPLPGFDVIPGATTTHGTRRSARKERRCPRTSRSCEPCPRMLGPPGPTSPARGTFAWAERALRPPLPRLRRVLAGVLRVARACSSDRRRTRWVRVTSSAPRRDRARRRRCLRDARGVLVRGRDAAGRSDRSPASNPRSGGGPRSVARRRPTPQGLIGVTDGLASCS